MEVIIWLLLPAYSGIQTGMLIFLFSYSLVLLSTKYNFTKSHIAIHFLSLIVLAYLVFFNDSKFSEELRRATSFVIPYIIGSIFTYVLAYKLVWKDIYEKCSPQEIKPRGLMLSSISIFLAYICILNIISLFSIITSHTNTSHLFISALFYIFIVTLIYGISSVGIWFNQRLGALIFIWFLFISLPILYFIKSLNINSLFIPIMITLLLIPKLKFMKQTKIKRTFSLRKKGKFMQQ